MKIEKTQTGIAVEFDVAEWDVIVKKDPKLFTDVVNAIADGGDYITFPSEDCFGDVKGGISTPIDPAKVVEDNRENLLKEIETIIGSSSNISEKEKELAMKKGEKIVDNLANLYSYAKEKNLNISNKEDIDKLRKKIAEVMEEDEEEEW